MDGSASLFQQRSRLHESVLWPALVPVSSGLTEPVLPLDGVSLPSPVRQLEDKYGGSDVIDLCRKMSNVSVSSQARESIKRILETHQRSLKSNIPIAQRNSIESQGVSNRPHSATAIESINRSKARDLKIVASPIPPPKMKPQIPTQTQTEMIITSTSPKFGEDEDRLSDDCREYRSPTALSTSIQLSLISSNGKADPSKFICLPTSWSPSSLSYATVEINSRHTPAIARKRQKKARALYHKERLEQEIIAREKYYEIREQTEHDKEKKKEENHARNHLRHIEFLQHAQITQRMIEENQRQMEKEKKIALSKIQKDSRETEKKLSKQLENEAKMRESRASKHEKDKERRERIYKNWEKKINEKKEKLFEREQEASKSVSQAIEHRLQKASIQAERELIRLSLASERKKRLDKEAEKVLEYPEKLEKVETNRFALRKSLEEKYHKDLETLEQKVAQAYEKQQKEMELKRNSLVQKNKVEDKQVSRRRSMMSKLTRAQAKELQDKLEKAKTRKMAQEQEKEVALQEVADHLVEKSLRVDLIKLEKEQNERILRHVRKLETQKEDKVYENIVQSLISKDYERAIGLIPDPPSDDDF